VLRQHGRTLAKLRAIMRDAVAHIKLDHPYWAKDVLEEVLGEDE
jgi:hypothetical protein